MVISVISVVISVILVISVIPVTDMCRLCFGSGMKATAELSSQAKKAVSDIMFSCICSNEFNILISFNLNRII